MKANMYRDVYLKDITEEQIGQTLKVSGWVENIRDHGGVSFIDLRDMYGVLQVVLRDTSLLTGIVKEDCVSITGLIEKRDEETYNPKIATGTIELEAKKIQILGKVYKPLPFEVMTSKEIREDVRLKYRYLDLRRPDLQRNLILKSRVMQLTRSFFTNEGFLEIETPMLGKSTPEGARDFLVPSRLHPGEFYALPQAPQQFKQLLMISGFDKYYQIAPCFRDEDPRADRAPGEFYQVDFEMSFATQEDVLHTMEELITTVFKKHTNWKVDEAPFIRIPYREAMEKYGIDKPDLRNPLIIQDATELFKDSEFNAFKDKTIKAIVVPNGAVQGRKFFDSMTEFAVEEQGAKGLAWTKIDENNTPQGGIAKFITEDILKGLEEKLGAKAGDSIFFVADKLQTAQKIAGQVRIELGKRLDLIEKNTYKFCFIVDFPMYEYNDDEGKIDFNHNPFSMPQGGMEALENKDPLDILAYQFDLVGNGYEMASGAVRNHDPKLMVKAFEIAGYSEKNVEEKFGALYKAFKYGTPPHAGAAPGLDRMIMLIADTQNIREVIAFPKNKKARDAMMNAPSRVEEQQLKDVHIKIDE